MLLDFEKKLADFVKANNLVDPADKVLLAVSGGADSTALLHAMQTLKTETILSAGLSCAHINHQLRGAEADLDEDFVTAQAAGLKLAVTTKRVDVRAFARRNKLSLETAARQLRIESLLDIAKANKCSRIATAHQKNDNAETILHRLLRGTGFRGLGGIWPIRAFADEIEFIRPLLHFGRDEIIEYLQKRNLKWRRDRTNTDCTYRRNYIRHRLLPALQRDCTGSVVEQLSELAQSARGFYSTVCTRTDKLWPKVADCAGKKVTLDLKMFPAQSPPVKVELIRRSLANIGCGERDLTQRHYERLLQLAEQNMTGRKVQLPGAFAVRREYGNLIFAQGEEENRPDERIDEAVRLEIPGRIKFGRYLVEATILDAGCSMLDARRRRKTAVENRESRIELLEWFDLEKITLPLMVRFRRPGDRFIPLGLAQEKKVGKFLTAQRVPHEIRRKLLIVADGEKMIWVWPVRISEQAKVTDETQKILQLQITDSSDR